QNHASTARTHSGVWKGATVDPAGHLRVAKLSCAGSKFCMGIDPASGVAVSWDGTRWGSSVPVDSGHTVTAVSCASARLCNAVDNHGSVVHWNGRGWSAARRIDKPRTSHRTALVEPCDTFAVLAAYRTSTVAESATPPD